MGINPNPYPLQSRFSMVDALGHIGLTPTLTPTPNPNSNPNP